MKNRMRAHSHSTKQTKIIAKQKQKQKKHTANEALNGMEITETKIQIEQRNSNARPYELNICTQKSQTKHTNKRIETKRYDIR